MRDRTGRAGPWLGRTSRLLACGKGGGFVPALGRDAPDVYGRPTLFACLAAGGELSVLRTRCGGGLPRAPREGAVPPSIPSKGALPPRPPNGGRCPPYPPLTSRVAPAGSLILQLGGNTRTRAEDLHRPSVSERPQARRKVLCQAFFQESGRRFWATSWAVFRMPIWVLLSGISLRSTI